MYINKLVLNEYKHSPVIDSMKTNLDIADS